MVNVDETFMETASHLLCCCRDNLKKFRQSGCASWILILGNLKKKRSTRKAQLLSISGKVTLLNSILSSIPIYIMSFFLAPVKIIKEIIKIQSKLL